MNPEETPEEKYRTLIIIGIICSILIIIGIFVTIGITAAKIAVREISESSDHVYYADTTSITSYEQDSILHYQPTSSSIEAETDSLRAACLANCTDCSARIEFCRYLETSTDSCARLIRELASSLGDTMSIPGVYGSSTVSRTFFRRTEMDEELFAALFEYRETTEELARNAGFYDPLIFRSYFPLREPEKNYEYTQSWDESQFEKEPVDVMLFLRNLEIDLRYYENRLIRELNP